MRHQVIARSLIPKGMKKSERCRAMAENFVHAVQEWPIFRTFVFFVNGPSMFGELRKAIFYGLCKHWRWAGEQAEPPVKYSEEELLDRFLIAVSWLLNGGAHSDLDWPESELSRPFLLGMLTPKAEVSWNSFRIQVGLYEGYVWAFTAANVLALGRASHDQENQQKSRNARVFPGVNIVHTCEPPHKELLCCAVEPELLLNMIEDDPVQVSFLRQTPTPLLMGPAVTSSMEWGLLRYGPQVISLEDPSALPFVLTPLGKALRTSKGRDSSANLFTCFMKMAGRRVTRKELHDAAAKVKSQRLQNGVELVLDALEDPDVVSDTEDEAEEPMPMAPEERGDGNAPAPMRLHPALNHLLRSQGDVTLPKVTEWCRLFRQCQ